jgi:DNA polymerase III delta prime subunit
MTTKIDYSPKSLDDFVFFNDETEQTIRAIVSGEFEIPCQGTTGLLLFGSAGTGKTEFAKRLPDFIEIARGGESTNYEFYACGDGDDGGTKLIADLRKKLNRNPLTYSRANFYVLDEVDHLQPKIQQSLKGILNSRFSLFILTTNSITKVDPILKDRCLCLPFLQAPAVKWLPLAKRIAGDKGLHGIGDETLLEICRQSNGSARELYRRISTTSITVKATTAALFKGVQ